jgi:hypothetical protein
MNTQQPSQDLNNKSKLNILISWVYFDKRTYHLLKNLEKGSYRLLIDSGAFTSWTLGKKIQLKDYLRFIDSISDLRPFNYAQLDVIGDSKATYKNLKEMHRLGYKDTLPIFTRGESLSRLDELYSYNDYLMLGGVAKGIGNLKYIKWFLNNNKGRKLHILGCSEINIIKYYKPTSVDSSLMILPFRYNNIYIYKGDGKIKSYQLKKILSNKEKFIKDNLIYLKNLGFSNTEINYLRSNDAYIYHGELKNFDSINYKSFCYIVSMASIFRYMIDIEKKNNTIYYLSLTTSVLEIVINYFKIFYNKGIIK